MVLIGEVLFPLISDRFTADYWDIPAYALGTLAYVIAREFPVVSISELTTPDSRDN
ncbi:hypothetical protein ACFQ0R_00935 [Psychroflexus salinarum]|uniref:Uncharacterized protein n=1 Tax=Psychroflexus salinarum TaxID=546024 RepID=A0ABW3GRA1_9FLAO